MYRQAFDREHAIAVGHFRGSSNTEADYEAHLSGLEELVGAAPDLEAPVFLLRVDPDNPPPDARWRRRYAEVSRRVPEDALFLFVGGSALTRGVVTAISWLAPRQYETRTLRTVEEAIAFVRERRSVDEAVLRRLLRIAEGGPPDG